MAKRVGDFDDAGSLDLYREGKKQARRMAEFLQRIDDDVADGERWEQEEARRDDIAHRLAAGGEAGFETE